jgi:CHAT domain-containing protein/tetratricopeptide (TPR) repeat protein
MARQLIADALKEVLDGWENLDLPPRQQAQRMTSQRARQVLDKVELMTHRRSAALDAAVTDTPSATAAAAVAELEYRLLQSRDDALRRGAKARQAADNDQAEDAARAATAISDGLFEDEGFGRAINLLGQIARARGDTLTGLAFYDAARELAERNNLPHTLCAAEDNRGMSLASMGSLDEAVAEFKQAARAATTADEVLAVTQNWAITLADAGRVRDASALLQSIADETSASVPLPPLQRAVMLDNLAAAALTLGDLDRAGTLLHRARPIFDGLDNRLDRARHALLWAALAQERHDRAAEVAAFTEAHDLMLSHWRANADVDRYVTALRTTFEAATLADAEREARLQPGLDLLNAGEPAQAIAPLIAVYQEAEAADDRYVAARAAAHAGMALREVGHVDEAHACLRRAEALARQAGDARVELQALWNLKLLADQSGEVGGDLTGLPMLLHVLALEELLPSIADTLGMQGLMREAYLGGLGSTEDQLGRLAASHGADDLARSYFAAALERASPNPATPAEAFARANRLAEKVIALPGDATPVNLAELEHLATTWASDRRVVQSTRRALGLHHMRAGRWEQAAEQLAISCERGEAVRRTLTAQQRAETGSALAGPWLALMECRVHLRDADGALQASQAAKGRHIVDSLDARATAQGNGAPLDVHEVRQRLGQLFGTSGTCLVDLFASSSMLMLIVVNDHQAELRVLPVPDDGSELARIEQTATLEGAPGLLRLVREGPVLEALATEVARLVPAGAPVLACLDPVLQQLPLHALTVGGTPWCDRNAWSLLPAVGLLRHVSAQPLPRHERCFIAGDSRGDLPGASRECQMIAQAVGAVPALGQKCTVQALHHTLAQGPLDVIHLAVHGMGDRARGRYSGLVMADAQQGSALVPFDQLTAVGLRADLVVLSGCSTAVSGPLHRSRMAGVSVAAIESGARSVIGCLWPVDDIAAEMFMKAFYGELVQAWNSGPVDLRACMDAGRAAVRTWLASAAVPAGHARDGTRDMPAEIAGAPGQAPLDPADAAALSWAPFILIGDPVLFG